MSDADRFFEKLIEETAKQLSNTSLLSRPVAQSLAMKPELLQEIAERISGEDLAKWLAKEMIYQANNGNLQARSWYKSVMRKAEDKAAQIVAENILNDVVVS